MCCFSACFHVQRSLLSSLLQRQCSATQLMLVQTSLFLSNECLGRFQSLAVLKKATVNSQSSGYAVSHLCQPYLLDWFLEGGLLGPGEISLGWNLPNSPPAVWYHLYCRQHWILVLFTGLTNRILSNGWVFAKMTGKKWYLVFLLRSKVFLEPFVNHPFPALSVFF